MELIPTDSFKTIGKNPTQIFPPFLTVINCHFFQMRSITPGEKLNFETPTLIMTSGLDGIPGTWNFKRLRDSVLKCSECI